MAWLPSVISVWALSRQGRDCKAEVCVGWCESVGGAEMKAAAVADTASCQLFRTIVRHGERVGVTFGLEGCRAGNMMSNAEVGGDV